MNAHRLTSLLSILTSVSLGLLPGCGGGDDDAPDAAAIQDAATPIDALVIGGDRPVTVHVSSAYEPGTPAPLLILLHGYSASGFLQNAYFQLQPQAEERGFIYAIPDGTIDAADNQFWNATDACCDLGGTDVDDSGYLRSVIEQLQGGYTVDPKRIY